LRVIASRAFAAKQSQLIVVEIASSAYGLLAMTEEIDMDWQQNLITNDADILELARSSHRVAVLGIRSEKRADRAAFYVPQYLVSAGVEIVPVPVPVYESEVETILGQRVYRDLISVPGEIDLVDVFRRSEDIPPHLSDIIAKKPKAVWFQLGIRNDAAAEELAWAGIKVVQDRCLMVEHRRSRM
jgi:hypothetical protein